MESRERFQNRSITVLIKPVSSRCNLNCEYCFYLEKREFYPNSRKPKKLKEAHDRLFAQVKMYNPQNASFCWQGGEPTLAGLDFFKYVVSNQKRVFGNQIPYSNMMQTNGLLIDREWAKFLKRNGFLLGLSLDGPEQYHNKFRLFKSGKGSHARVLKATKILNEFEVDFNILTLVSRGNVKSPEEVYHYLLGKGFYYLQFIPCVEREPAGEIAPFSIHPEEYGDFLCGVFDEWIKDGYPQVYIRFFENILQQYLGLRSEACIFQEKCGEYFLMEHNGDLYPCDFFVYPHWKLGNIGDGRFEDILSEQRALKFKYLKSHHDKKCDDCKWFWACKGGCPRYWFDQEGKDANYTYFCEAYKKFFEHTEETCKKIVGDFIRSQEGQYRLAQIQQETTQAQKTPPDPQYANPGANQKIGRNSPCPCGSGKKWKHCCGKR